jgi:hypothetical protein
MAKVDLFPDFRLFLESLNSAKVRYMVVGGYAVIYYGYRRSTDDLDVWVALDPENARLVSDVLQSFGGFPASQVPPDLFVTKGKVFIFGREPARIDVLTSPSGVDFDVSYARRNEVNWDGVTVPLISFEDLKRNKSASGRAKDLADLENLPPQQPDEVRAAGKGRKSAKRRRGGR